MVSMMSMMSMMRPAICGRMPYPATASPMLRRSSPAAKAAALLMPSAGGWRRSLQWSLDARYPDWLSQPGPVLIDAVVDTNELMLPPMHPEDYVEELSKALDRGAHGRAEIELRVREQ